MKKLDFHTFHSEAFTAFPQYKSDNAWFGFDPPGNPHDPKAPGPCIASCWLAYEKAQGTTTGLLILGDTKIRTEHDLVLNFGLSSANGVQEEESIREIQELQNQRDGIAAGQFSMAATGFAVELPVASPPPMTSPGFSSAPLSSSPYTPSPFSGPGMTATGFAVDLPVAGPPPVTSANFRTSSSSASASPSRSAIPVVGQGAILSTKGWSPMLNDTFIMAGAHKERGFYIALSPDEKAIFERSNNAGLGPKDNWRNFILANPRMLWDVGSRPAVNTGLPRVLLRELLGLRAFGYKPQFDSQQLAFMCKSTSISDSASFAEYLNALKEVRFEENDKAKLIPAMAEFLFDDKKALDGMLKG